MRLRPLHRRQIHDQARKVLARATSAATTTAPPRNLSPVRVDQSVCFFLWGENSLLKRNLKRQSGYDYLKISAPR
ncbi:uncharacterized protein PHALS_14865 [Plasmopara halstedii]|uniref:Uncharacterized protein n=1 Tax=Plasmopara halstedii TaxID=4781 RepID=A0A0P1A8J0_PLAHL|nr:uncharacterized protein PHALS_14865 [Plasmopara halstedii]CEG36362.1 hypothetical protein PHALS_14865 [Plasmopara halstedii]|eukprot:XP_024572731.1 hypothetical protein PHALS_14865 [Plasmopara halstedii]